MLAPLQQYSFLHHQLVAMGGRRRGRGSYIPVCFHVFTIVLLFICFGLSLSLGIWALRTSFGSLGRLSWDSRNLQSVTARRGGVIAASLSSVYLLGAIFGLLSLRVNSLRYVYVSIAFLTLGVSTFFAVIAWALCSTHQTAAVRERLSKAWFRTSNSQLCVIESARACRAFIRDCGLERCAQNCGATVTRTLRCYIALSNLLFLVSLPVAIISSMTGFLVLIDIFVVFAL